MISISLVLYNTKKNYIERLLKSIKKINIIYYFIIVDNSPSDSLKCLFSEYVYIHNPKNLGYGSSHNIAMKLAISKGFKYHVILNPDIFFQIGTIEKLYCFIAGKESVGLLMPKVLFPNNHIQYLCKLLPNPLNLFSRRFLPNLIVNKLNYKYEMKFFNYNQTVNVPNLSGCFMFLNLDFALKVNFFDESFFMYCEDLDLTRRLHGISSTYFYPYATIYHDHQKDSYKNLKMLFYHIKSVIIYFNKWGWFFDKERRNINKKTIRSIVKNQNTC